MNNRLRKSAMTLFFIEAGISIFAIVFYVFSLFADSILTNITPQYDYFTYSHWATENDQDYLFVKEKNAFLNEQIYSAEGIINDIEIVANVDMNAQTITFYNSDKSQEYAFGFTEFTENSLIIDMKRANNKKFAKEFSFFKKEK